MSTRVIAGRYHLLEKIGEGGFAEVYRAMHVHLEKVVAVKLLREVYSHDPDFTGRFKREARAVAKLKHPNIVDVYDSAEADGRLYIAMEYAPGNLKDHLTQHAPLSEEEARRLTVQILAGLAAAHDAGLIHRDMKPGNVLVARDGTLKITDFGIVKAAGEMGLTQTGMVLGTPPYMSPDQALGHELSVRSDLYAVGVMLYEMLSGRLPFEGATPLQVIGAQLSGQPRPLREVAPGVSAEMAQLVERAMARDPQQRYGSAGEMLGAIREMKRREDPEEQARDKVRAGESLLAQGRIDEAVQQMEAAYRLHPAIAADAYSRALGARADRKRQEGGGPRLEAALVDYKRAHEVAPSGEHRAKLAGIISAVERQIEREEADTRPYRRKDIDKGVAPVTSWWRRWYVWVGALVPVLLLATTGWALWGGGGGPERDPTGTPTLTGRIPPATATATRTPKSTISTTNGDASPTVDPFTSATGVVTATGEVAILSHSSYTTSGGARKIVGEVRNDTDGPIKSVLVTATVYDKARKVVGTDAGYSLLNGIPAGATAPFNVNTYDDDVLAAWSGYSLKVTWEPDPDPPKAFTLRITNEYTDSLPKRHIVGEVRNNTGGPVEFAEVTYTLYNNAGEVVNVGSGYTVLSDISAGKGAAYDVAPETLPAWSRFKLDVDWSTASSDSPKGLAILSSSAKVEGNFYTVTGEVKNNSGRRLDFVQIGATFYDEQNKIIAANRTYPYNAKNETDLEAGEKRSFEISVDKRFSGSRYELAVQGREP